MPSKSLVAITLISLVGVVLSGCTLQQAAVATPASSPTTAPTYAAVPAVTPTAAAASLPALTLKPGDYYFSVDGVPSVILSRNITGKTEDDLDTLLEWSHQGGTKVIRVHLTHGWWGEPWINRDWTVNEKWALDWERVFDQAQADGIYVIPVFGVWADWNDGKPDYGSPFWQYNPLNRMNGGPISSPTELFQSDSAPQKHWIAWVQTLVKRWQGRKNIAAWEIFSEINIASGAPGKTDATGGVDEASGIDFTNKSMGIIHSADAQHRPVTLSLAGVYSPGDPWEKYYALDSLDFIEIHPYSDNLDRELIKEVREYEAKYQKPVLIGESGLWSMTHQANASVGIEHAIWAGTVSGAMNARGLWDHDGYSIYSYDSRADAMKFMEDYATVELPVVRFVRGIDFTGFLSLRATSTPGIWGATLGNENTVIGWYRDAGSEPPDWDIKPVVSKQSVTISVPGPASQWRVDFYDTKTGTDIIGSAEVPAGGHKVTIKLPDFTDDIAFKMYAVQ